MLMIPVDDCSVPLTQASMVFVVDSTVKLPAKFCANILESCGAYIQ